MKTKISFFKMVLLQLVLAVFFMVDNSRGALMASSKAATDQVCGPSYNWTPSAPKSASTQQQANYQVCMSNAELQKRSDYACTGTLCGNIPIQDRKSVV